MKRRILSIILSLLMVVSVTGTAIATETVTVTQNGVTLNGAVNVPLSFTPTVAFPVAVAEGTSLTGFTVTPEGGEAISVTATASGSTGGYFTTATVELRKLTAGVKYTLSVPAIGSNETVSVTFSTVSAPYYINEELNGYTLADWYGINSNKRVSADSSKFTDSDTDGINDTKVNAALDNGRWYGPRLWDIPVTDATELTFEARFKPAVGKNGLFNGYANANGSLFSVGYDMSGNGRRSIRTQAFGTSGYGIGGSQSSANWSGEIKYPEFTVSNDNWYTARITLNSSENKYKVFIYDDFGNALETAYVNLNYNVTLKTIETIHFSYVDVRGTEHVDYIKVWDNGSDSLGDVAVVDASDADLNGAIGVNKDSLQAVVSFTNPINADDADRITISGNAVLTKTLSEDGKSIALSVSGLNYNKKYYINVPQIGANKAKVISFTTESAPINVMYKDGDDEFNLKDATDVPISFEASCPITGEADADFDFSQITVSPSGVAEAYISNDGQTLNLKVTNLEYLSKYTLHIPAIGDNAELNLDFTTENGKYLFRADFDKNDLNNYSFVRADFSTASTITSGVDTGTGLLTYTHGTSYYANLKFDSVLDISGKNIAYESVVKFTKGKDTSRPETAIDTSKTFYGIRGESNSYSMKIAGVKGYFATGSKDNVSEGEYNVSEYPFNVNTRYKIRFEFTAGNKNYKVFIKNLDDPTAKTVVISGASDYAFEDINGLYLPYAWQYGAVVEYMHVIDRDIEHKIASTPEFSSYDLVAGEEVSVTTTYVDSEIEEGMLILAVYDKHNQITRVNTSVFELNGSGEVKTATATVIPATNETMIKAFVWDSLSGMNPYSGTAVLASNVMRETSIYVSKSYGDDETADGSDFYPYKSFEAAFNELKRRNLDPLYKDSDMEIVLCDGKFDLNSTVNIDASTVSELNSVTIRGIDDAGFRGGVNVTGSDFRLVTDEETLAILNPAVHGKVYALDLSDYGINLDFSDVTKTDPMRIALYYNGATKTMARYPNYSNLYAEKVSIISSRYTNGTAIRELDINDTAIKSSGKTVWANVDLSETWTKGWYFYDWEQLYGRVTDVSETGITADIRTNRSGVSGENTKYFVYNLPYEIDISGEYAIFDNVLYYYPSPTDVSNGNFVNAKIQLNTNMTNMFRVSRDRVTFENLAFENQGNSFIDADGENISILGCEFFNSSARAIRVNGNYNLISACDFHDIGGLAADIFGGDVNTLTPSGTVLENCYFEKTGQISRTGVSAFRLTGCQITVRRNTITKTPHTAISYVGNNHIIEYNDIYGCLTDNSVDAGIIYAGRNLANIGTVIRYNYIHDTNSGYGAVYWDDRLSGQRAIGNVFENVYFALFIHAGICNTFNDNILVKGSRNNSAGITVRFRGRTYNIEKDSKEYVDSNGNKYNMWFTEPFFANSYSHTLNTFLATLVGSDSSALGNSYPGVPWEGEIWQNAYGVGSATDENINTDENYKHVLNYVNYKQTRKIEETVMKNNYFAGFTVVGIGNNIADTSVDYINPITEIVNENNTFGDLTGDRLVQYNNVVNNCGIYSDSYRD